MCPITYMFRPVFENVDEVKTEIYSKIENGCYIYGDKSLEYSIENNPDWQSLKYSIPDDLENKVWFYDVGARQEELLEFKAYALDPFFVTLGNTLSYQLKFRIYFQDNSSDYNLFEPFPGSTIKGICLPNFEILEIHRELSQTIEPPLSLMEIKIKLRLESMSNILFIQDKII